MSNKQTAVEWLAIEFEKWSHEGNFIPDHLLEQAKEMEKKQIIDAANGYTQTEYLGVTKGEKYYNEEYGKL